MRDNTDHILLNVQEAAAVLQPYMRNKSALTWLENDRLYDPAIPFHILQGQPYYVGADVLAFITRVLNPAARFVRIENQLRPDNRSKSERRKLTVRRLNAAVVLSYGIERRQHLHGDRRASSLDRRSQAAVFIH